MSSETVQVFSAVISNQETIHKLKWTTDPRFAENFLFKYRQAILFEGTAHIRDIQDDRINENEDLIKRLSVLKQHTRLELSTLPHYDKTRIWADVMTQFLLESSDFWQLIPLVHGNQYGKGHAKRVLNLTSYLALLQGFNSIDTEIAMVAGLIHDIGRDEHNLFDDHHGDASVSRLYHISEVPIGNIDDLTEQLNLILRQLNRRLPKYPFKKLQSIDVLMLTEAVAMHSLNDPTERLCYMQKNYQPAQYTRFIRLIDALKDADGLDRVRFGDNLDIRYLRSKHAKQLLNIACEEVELVH